MKTPEFPETLSRQGLATLLGLSPRHVARLAKEDILVRDGAGKYPVVGNVARYVGHALSLEARRSSETSGDRLREARRLDLERAMARDDRAIIDLDEAQDSIASLVAMFAAALDALPRQAAPDDRGLQTRLTGVCDGIRSALSAKLADEAAKLKNGKEA
ncbi:hypothetical protein [Aureimonas sp. AU20]|uniref:hypothetical protein n=1 Tax=Aureimonas sp. AU20 TaxID=1349819 RepID=UPI0007205BAC|nr:hypothetical protein [Aureimonas sp. AU20]ALN73184.1 hypothetical protein M673_10665 [Aureimonas sp. AU20]